MTIRYPNQNHSLSFHEKLLHDTLKWPLYRVDEKETPPVTLMCNNWLDPSIQSWIKVIGRLCLPDDSAGRPIIRTLATGESFLVIRDITEDLSKSWKVQGPFFLPPSVKPAKEQVQQAEQPITLMQAYHAAILSAYLLFGKELELSDVRVEYICISQDDYTSSEPILIQNLSKQREELRLHHPSGWSQEMMRFIKEGRRSELEIWFKDFNQAKLGTTSIRSPLRNHLNLAICGIALATHAAIEGGVLAEIAYTLSDLYIQQTEACSSVEDISKVIYQCYFDLVERVVENQRLRFSRTISICREYIFNHIYESPSLPEIAGVVNLHPEYLSKQFKKEVGVSLGHYIRQERIEEAKRLLLYSDLPLTEICASLKFTDQSHFIKTFRQCTGSTPKQFRARVST